MKKRSAFGILISIIMTILLVPVIWGAGFGGTAMLTVSSVIQEERKEEILDTFLENKGSEWVYSFVEPMMDEVATEFSAEIPGAEAVFDGVLTEQDVEQILSEVYTSVMEGNIYRFDLTFIADRLKVNVEKFFDEQALTYVEENLETIYETLDENVKAEIKAEAKRQVLAEVEKEFDAQIDELIEKEVNQYIKENYPNAPEYLVTEKKAEYLAEHKEEIIAEARAEVMAEAEKTFDAEADVYIQENIRELYAQIDEETKQELIAQVKEEYMAELYAVVDESVTSVETEVNAGIQDIYKSEEYLEFEQIQEEYGINVYDFQMLNNLLKTAGYLCFGLGVVVILVLLLCYLFRPAGFMVSGIFVLIFGGAVKLLSGYVLPVANEMITTRVELPHESVHALIRTALAWVTEGMESSATIGIIAGVALILFGILLSILRRNKEA